MTPSSRRLAAIMFTDLVGFTELGQRDEEEALRLRAEHQRILRPLFAAHNGREVKSLGDGFLVEFASAMESARCAVEVQKAVAERNARPDAGGPIRLRIGIHLGDVVGDGDDIVGDAVNVASRIEPLADPGGICVSGPVYDQVRGQLRLPLEKLGARTLKHVEHPVDVYRVLLWGDGAPPSAPAAASTPLRLAVLPLANLSPDANDSYFADGLTDELITQTSRIAGLRVVPRTSVRRYKDAPNSLRDVARDLDVRLALEGTVRKAGNRVRITVQLLDPRSEDRLWSSQYDRPLDDIFAIQDDIAGRVAASISVHVRAPGTPPPTPPVPGGPRETSDLAAYALFLHGRKLLSEKGSEETIRQALALFEGAVERDPNFARAHVGIAEATVWLTMEGALPLDEQMPRLLGEARRALELDERIAEAHSVLAEYYLAIDDFEGARTEAERALELNPSLGDAYRWLAQIESGDGHIEEAIRLLETARSLDPYDVNVAAFLGRAYFYAGREGEAVAHWDRTESLVPFRTRSHRAEYYLSHGRLDDAERMATEMAKLRPTSIYLHALRGILAAKRGDRATAEREIENLERRKEAHAVGWFLEAYVYYALGDTDRFCALMEQCRTEGMVPVLDLLYSPLYADIRDDPRIQRAIGRPRGTGA